LPQTHPAEFRNYAIFEENVAGSTRRRTVAIELKGSRPPGGL